MYDIVIIGGGASGLAAALAACEQAHCAGRALPRILILEAMDKIGRPILRSGNGRPQRNPGCSSRKPRAPRNIFLYDV